MTAAASKDPKRKPTVYVVDDDDGMRRALTGLMTTVGYSAVPFARPGEWSQIAVALRGRDAARGSHGGFL
jgi:FixJ family two-component response regulator